MSFVFQYRCLFRVSMQEEGSGSALQGFSYTLTPCSRKLLEDHQQVFRAREAGFEVYYRLNPLIADPLLGHISSRVRFSFCLFQSEKEFFKRYEPDLTRETGPQLYLDNLTETGSIQPATKQTLTIGDTVQAVDAMKIYPCIFFASANLSSGGPSPTKFRIRDKFSPANVVREVPISAGGGSQAVTKIDMSDLSAGPYTLETDTAGSKANTIYIDNDVVGARALGLVDIYWETAQNTAPADGISYVVRFKKR